MKQDIAAKLVEQFVHFHVCPWSHHERVDDEQRAATFQHISLEGFASMHQRLPDTLSSSTAFPHHRYYSEAAASWKHVFQGTTAENGFLSS
jgi:hypothetical protein